MVRQAAPGARLLWFGALAAWAEDVTETSSHRSCLVLAAHPDDETLGCGATVMRRRDAGTPVTLVVATDGRRSSRSEALGPDDLAALRAEETTEAARLLGLAPRDVVRLGHEDGALADVGGPLVDSLADLVAEHRPEDLLVTAAGDPHPDHAALGLAARRALARHGLHGPRLLEYPVWQWRSPASWFAARPGSRRLPPRPVAVRTAGYLDRKRVALGAYRSQTTNLTGEAAWWVLDERFLVNFFRSHELFLPLR